MSPVTERIRSRAVLIFRRDPVDSSTEAGRADERFRRAALTAIASGGAKAIALAANLISIPLTLNYLGPERFGLWAAISSIYALLEFADLGIGNGLLNMISRAGALQDRPELRASVSSAFFLLAGIGVTILVLFLGLSPLFPWTRLFQHASPALISDARSASFILAVCFALNLPLGMVRRVQLGFQEGSVSNLWQCLASVLSLTSLLAAMRLKAGLPTLVLCLLGAPLVALALNWIAEFTYFRPWLMPHPRGFHLETVGRLMHAGILFVCLQVAALAMLSADPLIAASYLGLPAAADYAVAQRLFLFILAIQAMWLTPLWPAYGEAAARGDRVWIRGTLARTTAIAMGTSALAAAMLVVFRAQIFGAWLHRNWAPPLSLALGLGLCTVVLTAGSATSMFLNGVNALREQAGVAVLLMAVVILLKIQLCIRYGSPGLAWGMFFGYTLIMPPFWRRVLPRLLRV